MTICWYWHRVRFTVYHRVLTISASSSSYCLKVFHHRVLTISAYRHRIFSKYFIIVSHHLGVLVIVFSQSISSSCAHHLGVLVSRRHRALPLFSSFSSHDFNLSQCPRKVSSYFINVSLYPHMVSSNFHLVSWCLRFVLVASSFEKFPPQKFKESSWNHGTPTEEWVYSD